MRRRRAFARPLHDVLILAALFGLAVVSVVPAAATEVHQTKRSVPTITELSALPAYSQPALSDSGRYIAAFGVIGGKRVLTVDRIDGLKAEPFLVGGNEWRLNRFEWLTDDRLLLYVSVPSSVLGTPIVVTRLVLVDPAREAIDLMFKRENGSGAYQIQTNVLSTLPADPDHILIDLDSWDASKAVVRRASLRTKNVTRVVVQRALPNVVRFEADAAGRVRVGYGFTSDQKSGVLKLRNEEGDWLDHSDTGNTPGFKILGIPTDRPGAVLVNSEHEHPLGALYTYDINKAVFLEKLAQQDDSEIASIELSRDGTKLLSVHYASEQVETEYFDSWTRQLYKQLQRLLPDTRNSLVSITPDQRLALIRASASDIAPHYYLYQRDKQSLSFLVSEYADLQNRQLAKTRVHEYKARDGLVIRAFVTLPSSLSRDSRGPLPFVVLPHGGPHSRDFLRFDWLTQLIASQGYGVLQMNFRGSTGAGSEHMLAGARQWGEAMQDDVTDGTHWLITEGFADPNRICIAGGSYGGYAALMGAVKEPDLYQCAISLNGVSDLPELLRLQSRFIGGRYATRYIGRLWRDRSTLRKNSPALQAGNIKVPVLLVHGADDRVVNVKQSRRMQKSLAKAGVPHEYLELPEGDHFLTRGANREAFAKRAAAFLKSALTQ